MTIQHFGRDHVFLHGRAARYHVPRFSAPVSVKTVVRGEAVWRTDEGVFPLRPGQFLIINDQHDYSIEVEAREVVETFCVFFRRGFVEDAAAAMTKPDAGLLDDDRSRERSFIEAVQTDRNVLEVMSRLGHRGPDEESMLQLSEALVNSDRTLRAAARRLPASKPATRRELLRRALRARDFVDESLRDGFTLDEVAAAAALSPFHLHRTFRDAFGETVHQYATRKRAERAATLLRHTTLPISDVTRAIGLRSDTSFAAMFRRFYGTTPTLYRTAN